MAIANIQLGTSETTIIQAGSSETRAVLVIVFCNTSSATHTMTVYAYPSGSAGGDGATIISQLPIAAGDSYIWSANEKFILAPNDKISGLADAAAVITATPSYMVI